jgi:hypothetical protein
MDGGRAFGSCVWHRRCAFLLAASLAQAAPAMADCTAEIVAILDGARKHGPSQETTTRVLMNRENKARTLRVVSKNGSIVRNVPPDRMQVTILRDGRVATETITIGVQHWARTQRKTGPDIMWTAEKPTETGVLAQVAEELAKSIRAAECVGAATLEKRAANLFRFETSAFGITARSTLWAEPGANRPMRWVNTIQLEELETTSTTDYVYDPTIRIDPPVAGK